ncbi:MAG: hypothetical protein HGA82_03905, partial [Anaerolineales bacterium]|nr:hypothetical protein [Anaerolineales bacterium]
SRRLEELDRLTTQLETVQAEATAVMGTQVGLATQVAFVTSEAAVEKWAYEDGKWVRDGETLVEILPAGEPAATEVPTDTARSEEVPNWKLWWELFFGDQH